jgi:hypothetical protein
VGKFFVGWDNYGTSTTAKTACKVIGAAGKRFEVVEVIMTGAGKTAAADIMHQCQAAFLSNATAGTPGASPTPEKVDQAGAASALTAGVSYSAEPTAYNTNTFPLFGFNQRGGMRWAVPQGEGFKSDGGQSALSFGVRVVSSAAGNVDGNAFWWEP